ncbi:MAG: 4-phosphoerythronate dehydrogenase PdxB [Alteromonadaceae bacterium]|nr:4-phosphoerythronate dehydrogenase PdxB [Alteromonadaceae bacterium]
MHIVADENIPLLNEFFADIGTITRLPGRMIRPEDVQKAEVLLVRSVTHVDSSLLANSSVKFVGTATIGTDHVDEKWLEQQGIAFAAAPGCNAEAVVQYVISCLSLHAELNGEPWARPRVGIIGCGNVGGRLRERLDKLGFQVVACDPLLEKTAEGEFSDLDQALDCDVITLHTPLTREGPYPTHHLLNEDRLARLREDQLLINTSRGSVIDTDALAARLSAAGAPTVILDVWENEPQISTELLEKVWLGTPHIAGYTLEGKANGTGMIYQALSRYLGLPVRKKAGQFMPDPGLSRMTFTSEAHREEALALAIRATYDPRRDDTALRRTLRLPDERRAAAFDEMRKKYRTRREFASIRLQLKGTANELQHSFKTLGFRIKS